MLIRVLFITRDNNIEEVEIRDSLTYRTTLMRHNDEWETWRSAYSVEAVMCNCAKILFKIESKDANP